MNQAEKAKRASLNYITNQLWRMRWPSGVIVALMVLFTFTTGMWIPYLAPSILSLGLLSMSASALLQTMMTAFLTAERNPGTDMQATWKKVGHCMWTLYGLQLVFLYWLMMYVVIYLYPKG